MAILSRAAPRCQPDVGRPARLLALHHMGEDQPATGTPCPSDAACAGLVASHCLIGPTARFCTVQGGAAWRCGAPYVCCHDCDQAPAGALPFERSACIPEAGAAQLTMTLGCTCE